MRRSRPASAPTLLTLFAAFAHVSLTSFGGGMSGWMLREFVTHRRWLDEEEFLNALSISQALPGVNVANIAIWVGYRLMGFPGAVIGLLGIVAPGAVAVILIAGGFSMIAPYKLTPIVLMGAAAASIALSLTIGITAVRRVQRKVVPLFLMTATFVAVGILRWSTLWVMAILGAVSITVAYRDAGKDTPNG